jgi:multimeric flavodoxin WrbA
LFGFLTRYDAMAAQMKAFFDSTGSLWEAQKLAGKGAGFFIITGTQGRGRGRRPRCMDLFTILSGLFYLIHDT